MLQALVHEGILKGIRGPRGGYELARSQSAISAEVILRAASAAEDEEAYPSGGSPPVDAVIWPALREAERVFSASLARINIEEMMQQALTLKYVARLALPPAVHGLDSFGKIPLGGKVQRFANGVADVASHPWGKSECRR